MIRSTARESLLAFCFYSVIAFIVLAPLSLDPARSAANEGDPLHISWIMAWGIHQLVDNPLELFDSNTFHPYDDSLAFSEHLLAEGLIFGPIFLVTGNALLAQNIGVLLTLALSAWAMFFFLREAFENSDAALVGGVLYAFHSYMLYEIPRIQVLSVQWWPLAAVFLHRALVSGRWKDRALFGLFFLFQCLSCTYYLFYFSLILVVWTAGFLVSIRGGRKTQNALGLLPPLLFVGLVVLAIALPYLEVSERFRYERSLGDGVDLLDYVAPPEGTVFARWIRVPIQPGVSPHFMGFTAMGLIAVSLAAKLSRSGWAPRDASSGAFFWMSLVTGLMGIVFAAGPRLILGGNVLGSGPYALLYRYVPFLRSLRSAERVVVLVGFAVAVLGAYGAAVLLRRAPARLSRWLFVLLLVISPLEHYRGGQFGVSVPMGKRVPEVYPWLVNTPKDDPVVELPLFRREQHRFFALYMLYSTFHWRPILFGRTSFYPPSVDYLAWNLRDFPDRDSLGLLRAFGVRTIVVHPEVWLESERGERLAAIQTLADELSPIGVFPPLDGRDYHRLGLGGERVYRLQTSSSNPQPIRDLCSPRNEIKPDGWMMHGSGMGSLSTIVDRDPETLWRTNGQIPGHYLLVDLGREETLSAIRLSFGYPYNEFPRFPLVRVQRQDEPFATVPYRTDMATKLEVLETLLERPADAAIILRFEPQRVRRLRLWVGGREFDYSLPNWQLRELFLYRSCESPQAGAD